MKKVFVSKIEMPKEFGGIVIDGQIALNPDFSEDEQRYHSALILEMIQRGHKDCVLEYDENGLIGLDTISQHLGKNERFRFPIRGERVVYFVPFKNKKVAN